MRPIEKGPWPISETGGRIALSPYRKAASHLKDRTGKYCHLCEMPVTNGIAVEHIFNQQFYPRLKEHWANFLLVCIYCNSRKPKARLVAPYRKHYYWPHLHNTITLFRSMGGLVEPHPALDEAAKPKAQNLIDLYGLDEIESADGGSDERYIRRLIALKRAIDRKREFLLGKCNIEAVLDSAVDTGFFSVWYTIFQDVDEVRKALVGREEFKLAATHCFDPEGRVIAGVRTL